MTGMSGMKPLSKRYDPKEVEARIQKFWADDGIYKKVKKHRSSGPNYYFVDGPPYTTGAIHIGTAWNKILKDSVVRYRMMNGLNVRDQPGFDMHGLPIEVKVEKEVGIKNKKEIENYGVDKFIAKCKEFALGYQKKMTGEFASLGVWMDWEKPYLTINNSYIEAAWWTLWKAHERDLLFESERVLTWCPRCETALAEAEIEYWDETDNSIYVKFPLKGKTDEFIVIWTTTPWTLPANMAVAVHPDFTYVKVQCEKDGRTEKLILLEERFAEVLEIGGYGNLKILERKEGRGLEGLEYEHALADVVEFQRKIDGSRLNKAPENKFSASSLNKAPENKSNLSSLNKAPENKSGVSSTKAPNDSSGASSGEPSDKWAHKVLLGDIVTAENSGIVHIAPGHGPEDFELGKKYGIKPFCPVDERGNLTQDVAKFGGMNVKESNPLIIAHLEEKGLMLHADKLTHRYGHCWRCKTPIIYRITNQWFLRITRERENMLSEIKRVKWAPAWAGEQRFFNWVENARDWCISRQRYWGIPIPVWKCACGEKVVISSAAELKSTSSSGFTDGMDLHIPHIDKVKVKCPKCGGEMKRVSHILDVWFDSAIASWAPLPGYRDNSGEFAKWWPCRWITEAHDQTRGWFYSQLGAGIVAFGKSPYDSVLMHGFALDEKGLPMSKSAGNVVDPLKVADQFGNDSLRFYILRASQPWDDLPFSLEGVKNANKMLNILWNVCLFSNTYMVLDNFTGKDAHSYLVELDKRASPQANARQEDLWLMSRTENLKKNFTAYMETYEIQKACRELEFFILEDLSRWYVKLIRDRTWAEGKSAFENPDKFAAYSVLYNALESAIKLMAPIMPHMAEELYQHLIRTVPGMGGGMHGDAPGSTYESVHFCDWPKAIESRINPELERDMLAVQQIVEAALNARQKGKLKLRWPASEMIIMPKEGSGNAVIEAVQLLKETLKEQTNTKDVRTAEDDSWIKKDYKIEINKSEIGKKFGKSSTQIFQDFRAISENRERSNDEAKKVKAGKDITLGGINIPASIFTVKEELPQNIVAAETPICTVYVNVEITDAIKAEGFAREAIRRIQEMRKDLNLNVEDFIQAKIETEDELQDYLNDGSDSIMAETRSKELKIERLKDGTYPVDEATRDGNTYRKNWKVEDALMVITIEKA